MTVAVEEESESGSSAGTAGLRMSSVAAESVDMVVSRGGGSGSVCAEERGGRVGVPECGLAERSLSSIGDAGTGELLTGVVVMDRDGRVEVAGLELRVDDTAAGFSGEFEGDPNAHDMRYGFCERWRDGRDGRDGKVDAAKAPSSRSTALDDSAGESAGESYTVPRAPSADDENVSPPAARLSSSAAAAAAAAALSPFRPKSPPSVALRVFFFGVGTAADCASGTLPARSSLSRSLPFPPRLRADPSRSSADRLRPLDPVLSALVRSASLEKRCEAGSGGVRPRCSKCGVPAESGRTIVLALAAGEGRSRPIELLVRDE